MKRKRAKRQNRKMDKPVTIEQFLESLDREFQRRRTKTEPPYPFDKRSNTIKLPNDIESELRGLVLRGNKIEAVKRVTQLTGAGLRVSKDYVDGLLKNPSKKKTGGYG